MTVSPLFVRRFQVDVAIGAVTWHPVTGVDVFAPLVGFQTARKVVYSGGWDGTRRVVNSWSLTLGYKQRLDTGARPAAQQLIEACASATTDDDAKLWVRWYDRNGLPEAKQGRALVMPVPDATGWDNLGHVQVTFAGDGALTDIGNPLA